MDDIETVLSKVDIIELINSYLPLKKGGRNFKALCPFHSEKTPSFIVSAELQIYKCFGCQTGGNAIKFVSEYEKISFGEALRMLANKVGVKLSRYRPDKKELERERLFQINHLAAEFYHYLLTRLPLGQTALNYLLGRGVSKESIRIFKLGFAPAGWENLLRFLRGKKGYKGEEIEKAGLILASSKFKVQSSKFYDRFRERIVFPIFDHRGQVVGFSGRLIDQGERGDRGDQGAKYINTPETLLYHKSASLYGLLQAKEAIKKENSVILVEGEFDMLSSYQAGVKNIVAVKGTAVTAEQVELLKRFTDNFYFCLDADFAGQEAAKRGIEIAEAAAANIRAISLPVGKDPDECVRTNPSAWRQAVRKTIPIYDFYLKAVIEQFGMESGEAKKRVSEAVLPFFNKIQNEVMKAYYLKKLADVLKISEEAVVQEARRQEKLKKIYRLGGQPPKTLASRSRQEITEEYLLSLMLHAEDQAGRWRKNAKTEFLATPAVKRIFAFLKHYLGKEDKLVIKNFVKILPEELKDTVNRLYLTDLQGIEEKGELLLKEWKKGWIEVEKLALHDKLGKLREQLAGEESAGVEKEIVAVSRRLREL